MAMKLAVVIGLLGTTLSVGAGRVGVAIRLLPGTLRLDRRAAAAGRGVGGRRGDGGGRHRRRRRRHGGGDGGRRRRRRAGLCHRVVAVASRRTGAAGRRHGSRATCASSPPGRSRPACRRTAAMPSTCARSSIMCPTRGRSRCRSRRPYRHGGAHRGHRLRARHAVVPRRQSRRDARPDPHRVPGRRLAPARAGGRLGRRDVPAGVRTACGRGSLSERGVFGRHRPRTSMSRNRAGSTGGKRSSTGAALARKVPVVCGGADGHPPRT